MSDDSWDGVRRYVSFFLVPVLGLMIHIPFADDQIGQEYRMEKPNTSSSNLLGVFWNKNINVNDLAFNKAKFANGRKQWWTVLTHMFVHGNPNHLINNAMSMIQSGFSVSSNYGILATYTVFLGGGMFAALQSRDFQDQQVLSKRLALTFDQNDLTKRIGRWMDQSVRRVAPLLRSYAISYIGCSCGVAALEGMNLMIWLEEIVHTLVLYPNHHPSSSISTAFSVLSLLRYFAGEAHHVYSGTSTRVDHAGHVAGFCFGLGCFGVAKAISYVKRQLRNRKT